MWNLLIIRNICTSDALSQLLAIHYKILFRNSTILLKIRMNFNTLFLRPLKLEIKLKNIIFRSKSINNLVNCYLFYSAIIKIHVCVYISIMHMVKFTRFITIDCDHNYKKKIHQHNLIQHKTASILFQCNITLSPSCQYFGTGPLNN